MSAIPLAFRVGPQPLCHGHKKYGQRKTPAPVESPLRLSARVLRVKKRKGGRHRGTTKVAEKTQRVGVAA